MTRPRHTRSLPERGKGPIFKRSADLGRGEAPAASSSRRLRLCSDATDFLKWIEESLPSVVGEEASHHTLDQALLLLTKEYLSRRQHAVLHEDPPPGRVGFLCLPEVYHERASELYARQQAILRSMSFASSTETSSMRKPEEKPRQELFIGEELQDD